MKKNNGYIPVEVKAGEYTMPQKNHVLQLAAYCQLIEEHFRGFVPYGMLVYNNQDYTVQFDPRLRFELESVMKQMRTALKNKNIPLNHNDAHRCAACSLRHCCAEKLI
jgi:CRISPR-associated exonuclease Cas4